eukprot:7061921-Prymnesium_polylepis.1
MAADRAKVGRVVASGGRIDRHRVAPGRVRHACVGEHGLQQLTDDGVRGRRQLRKGARAVHAAELGTRVRCG